MTGVPLSEGAWDGWPIDVPQPIRAAVTPPAHAMRHCNERLMGK
jgi:hypothetical protein